MFRFFTGIMCLAAFYLPESTYSQKAIRFQPDDFFTALNEVEGPDALSSSGDSGRCHTPNGEEGKCLLLQDCPELLDLIELRNGIHTPGTADLLRNRICKYLARDAKLCCLTNSSTPAVSPPISSNGLSTGKPRPAILPTESECGDPLINIRISRGKDFKHGAHPWLAGVGNPVEGGSFKVECGGTLITRSHVLSAAHCFHREPENRSPQLTHVILGAHSLSKGGEEKTVMRIHDVKHPGYNATTYYRDIALLLLEGLVTFTDYIRPACLPFDSNLQTFNLQKDRMKIVGWGRTYFGESQGTDEPLEAELSLIPKEKCRKAYEFAPEIPFDDTQICLGEDGRDACRGDSGGPLLYTYLKRFHILIGIVSFGGIECGGSVYPGVYTYVPQYMDWILSNV